MKRLILGIIVSLIWSMCAYSEDITTYDIYIARVHYDGGGDWYSDPTSLTNLLTALRERLGLDVPEKEAVVRPDDEALLRYPMLYMTGHGNIAFSPAQVDLLRKYFDQGGFLWADDNYGMDVSFRREMNKVFPGAELVELPFSHPIYHTYYQFDQGLPKIHEHDNKPPQGFGIFHKGRLAVFYTYETDIGDGLESPEVHDDPPQKREQALQMAINIVLYVLNY